MPSITYTADEELPLAERKRIVKQMTAIVVDTLGVEKKKVQIFIEPEPGEPGTSLQMVAVAAGEALAAALAKAGYGPLDLRPYPADYTARGGELRQVQP